MRRIRSDGAEVPDVLEVRVGAVLRAGVPEGVVEGPQGVVQGGGRGGVEEEVVGGGRNFIFLFLATEDFYLIFFVVLEDYDRTELTSRLTN